VQLGWTPEEVGSFSLATLRDLVSSEKLLHEIDVIVRVGLHIAVYRRGGQVGVIESRESRGPGLEYLRH
jgi:hypothetical protein